MVFFEDLIVVSVPNSTNVCRYASTHDSKEFQDILERRRLNFSRFSKIWDIGLDSSSVMF